MPKYKNSEAMAAGISEFLKFASNPESYMQINKVKDNNTRYQEYKSIIEDINKKK